ncbi:MAG TPA: bifunctional nuclease family protein [Nitrospiria bacterium]|nr:bifunctional nuclease family protein [Nitrospiria bacterium]
MEIKLIVDGIVTDPNAESQMVILRDEKSKEILPIWVGAVEGNAIRFALEKIVPPRPMTHDLLKNMIDSLGAKIKMILVNEIKNNTYYASIYLECKGAEQVIDSRPSDAIALALRTDSPIYATEDVLKKRSAESLDEWLEKLKPKDFDKYDA